jgi:hypothetical protein
MGVTMVGMEMVNSVLLVKRRKTIARTFKYIIKIKDALGRLL